MLLRLVSIWLQTIAKREHGSIFCDRRRSFAITIAGSQTIAEVCFHIIADDRRTFCDLRSAIIWKPAFTVHFNNMRVLNSKFDRQCVFRYRQSNVRRLLPASHSYGVQCPPKFNFQILLVFLTFDVVVLQFVPTSAIEHSSFQFLYSNCRFDIVCFTIQLCSLKYSTSKFTQFNTQLSKMHR